MKLFATTTGALLLSALLPGGGALAGCLHYDFTLTLDPATRNLQAEASVTSDTPLPIHFRLGEGLAAASLTIDGQAVAYTVRNGIVDAATELPAGKALALRYGGSALATSPPRNGGPVPGMPVVGPDGSFLSDGSAWYPVLPGEICGYNLDLTVLGGQKGLAPGRISEEADDGQRYHARFTVDHPIDGIAVFAGPYTIKERKAGEVTLRTYFHSELDGLADRYLEQTEQYIERYGRQIGAYPYASFAIVSSPFGLGLGYPYLTYMGRQVLRLPFIPTTSLPHEILHSWWGNGVFIDYQRGNWAEGLTTYMADYALAAENDPAKGREMRLRWLADYAAMPLNRDDALVNFTSRSHGASQVIGYHKTAMLFHMLRRQIGDDAFFAGLRRFWSEQKFRTASWTDLAHAFEATSARDLRTFFVQWLERKGAPTLALTAAPGNDGKGDRVDLALQQEAPPYLLEVPVRIRLKDGRVIEQSLQMQGSRAEARISLPAPPASVSADPDFDLFRRLPPGDAPPILREAMLAFDVDLVTENGRPDMQKSAIALVDALSEGRIHPRDAWFDSGAGPLVAIGRKDWLDSQLASRSELKPPAGSLPPGSAQVWVRRSADGRLVLLIAVEDQASLDALLRPLPHYGSKSYIVFDGRQAIASGLWAEPPASTTRTFP